MHEYEGAPMKKLARWGLAVFLLLPWLYRPSEAGSTVDVTVSPGWDFYRGGQYRYGPSIIINPDDSVDIWTASPGDYGQWDEWHCQVRNVSWRNYLRCKSSFRSSSRGFVIRG